jgi:hypothetical protein
LGGVNGGDGKGVEGGLGFAGGDYGAFDHGFSGGVLTSISSVRQEGEIICKLGGGICFWGEGGQIR